MILGLALTHPSTPLTGSKACDMSLLLIHASRQDPSARLLGGERRGIVETPGNRNAPVCETRASESQVVPGTMQSTSAGRIFTLQPRAKTNMSIRDFSNSGKAAGERFTLRPGIGPDVVQREVVALFAELVQAPRGGRSADRAGPAPGVVAGGIFDSLDRPAAGRSS